MTTATAMSSEMASLPGEPLNRKSPASLQIQGDSVDISESMYSQSQRQRNRPQPFLNYHHRRLLPPIQNKGVKNGNDKNRPISDDYDNVVLEPPRLSLVLEERLSEIDSRSVSEAGDDSFDDSDTESESNSSVVNVPCHNNDSGTQGLEHGDLDTAHDLDSRASDASVSVTKHSEAGTVSASALTADERYDSLSTQSAAASSVESEGEEHVSSVIPSKELFTNEIGSGKFGQPIAVPDLNGQRYHSKDEAFQSVGKYAPFDVVLGDSTVKDTLIDNSGFSGSLPLESSCDKFGTKHSWPSQPCNGDSHRDDDKLEYGIYQYQGRSCFVLKTPKAHAINDELKSETETDGSFIEEELVDKDRVDKNRRDYCDISPIAPDLQAYPADMGLTSSRQNKARLGKEDMERGTPMNNLSKNNLNKNGVKRAPTQKEERNVKEVENKKKATAPLRSSSHVNKPSNGHPYIIKPSSSCSRLQPDAGNSKKGQSSVDKMPANSRGEGGAKYDSENPILGSTSHTTRGRRSLSRRSAPIASDDRTSFTETSKYTNGNNIYTNRSNNVNNEDSGTVTITSSTNNHGITRSSSGSSYYSPGYVDITSLGSTTHSNNENERLQGKNTSKSNDLVVIYSKPIPKELRAKNLLSNHTACANQPDTTNPCTTSLNHDVNAIRIDTFPSSEVSVSSPETPPLYSSLFTPTPSVRSHSPSPFPLPSNDVFRYNSHTQSSINGKISRPSAKSTSHKGEEDNAGIGDYDNPVDSEKSQQNACEKGPRSIDDLQAALILEHSIRRLPIAEQQQQLCLAVSVSSSEAGDFVPPSDGFQDSKRNSTSSSLFSSVQGESPDSLSDSQFHQAREFPDSSDNDAERRSIGSGRYRPSSRVRVTCQLRKSSTSDGLDSTSRDNNNPWLPRSRSATHDYYSLDRRSRLSRSKTIQDHARTVSMDQLLRVRRHSSNVSLPRPESTPIENLSVDDILKTCMEYEEDDVFNRDRPTSQSSRQSSMSQLSFIEAMHSPVSPDSEGGASHRTSTSSLITQVNPKTLTQIKTDVPNFKTEHGHSNKPVCPLSMKGPDNNNKNVASTRSSDITTGMATSTSPTSRIFSVSGIRVVPLDLIAKSKTDALKSRSFDSNHWPLVNDNVFPSTLNDASMPHSTSQPSLKGASPPSVAAVKPPTSSLNQGPYSPGFKHFNHSPKGDFNSSIWPRLDTIVSVEEDESVVKDGADTPTATSLRQLAPDASYHSAEIANTIPASLTNGSFSALHNNNKVHDIFSSNLTSSDSGPACDITVNDFDVTDGEYLKLPTYRDPASISTEQSIVVTTATLDTTTTSIATSSNSIITSSSSLSSPSSTITPCSHSASSAMIVPVAMDTVISRQSPPTAAVSSPLLVSGVPGSSVMTTLTVDTLSSATDISPSQSSSPAPRSPNSIAKLEAVEAIQWLRAAGFPQYAQMFEDGQFPIELALVEKDHDFLDKDSIQSLFRRLETLNKYAGMKIDAHQRKKNASEEEEDDDICALSERWQYQKSVRRWSRKDLGLSPKLTDGDSGELIRGGSHDSLLADQDSGSQTGDSPLLESKMPHRETELADGVSQEKASLATPGETAAHTVSPISPKLRRVASERIKTAKNLWKKMEGGLRSKKSRRQPNQRNILEISGPVVADQEDMQAKLQRLNCVDISPTSPEPSVGLSHETDTGAHHDSVFPSPTSPSPSSPQYTSSSPSSADQAQSPVSGYESVQSEAQSRVIPQPSSASASPSLATFRSRLGQGSQSLRVKPMYVKDDASDVSSHHSNSTAKHISPSSTTESAGLREYYNAQSQLLQTLESSGPNRKLSGNDHGLVEIFVLPTDHQPGMFPRVLQNSYMEADQSGSSVGSRAGSIRLGSDPSRTSEQSDAVASGSLGPTKRLGNRISMYDNFSPLSDSGKGPIVANKTKTHLAGVEEDTSTTFAASGGQQSKDRSVSFNSNRRESGEEEMSGTLSYRELRDKILSEASTPTLSLRSKSETAATSQNVISKDLQTTCPASRGVTQSVSVDSYLRDTGSDVNNSHSRKSSSGSSSGSGGNKNANVSLSEQFSEFDQILQQLFDNISDLTRCVGPDETEPSLQNIPKSSSHQVPVSSVTTTSSSSSSSASSATVPSSSSPLSSSTVETNSSSSSTTILSTSSSALYRGRHRPSGLIIPTSSSTSEISNLDSNNLGSPSSDSPLSPNSVDKSVDHENSSSGGGDSHTGESISDQEGGLGDLSHDDSLEQIPAVGRERRDSGVGHSLTRAPSDRRRKKIRWHSFQRCHRPEECIRNMQINSLTVSQMVWLRKASLLKLTGIMERCLPVNKSGWNWVVPKFMKKHKTPDFSDKNVFGVPLSVMVQRTGQPLPQCVLYAMRYLRRTSQNAVGIFRRSGVKSKIQQLIDRLEANPDVTDFEEMNAYNVADMLKTFFRELPECLLTNKLSETFRNIYTHVPVHQRLEAIQAAILILPDENREVLQSLLLFLSDISMFQADHQMNTVNLAVCFTPTVFMLGARLNAMSHSPKRHRKNAQGMPGVPDPREIMEQKTSQECLLMMINQCKKLFTVPPNLFRQVQTPSLVNMEPPQMFDLCGEDANVNEEVRAFGQERVQMVLKEAHDKNRGWIAAMNISNIDISHRKSMDDYPLREWKLVVDIDAPPIEVLRRIMHERHTWDEDLLSWSAVERINPHSDIFQYVLNSMAPHPCRHFCVLRYWRSDLRKGACALITMSVEHTDAAEVQGVRAIDLGSFFLMEPCGSGRSRLTHIIRVDTRGRRPEWYTKVFGHLTANFLERLRDSFKQDTTGPETKV